MHPEMPPATSLPINQTRAGQFRPLFGDLTPVAIRMLALATYLTPRRRSSFARSIFVLDVVARPILQL
jgi:hypothetical protein